MPVLNRNTVYRDYKTEGIPASGDYDPDKAEIRQYLGQLEALSASGAVMVSTKAELDAITDRDDNSPGYVVADSTDADNGIYAWDDAGAQWVRLRGFPDSVAVATNVGGTTNAITADTKTGVDPAEVGLLILFPAATTTSTTVTLALNGGAAESITDADASALEIGDLALNTGALLIRVASSWQLVFSASVVARAEAAQLAAVAAQGAAENAQTAAQLAQTAAEGATWTPDGAWAAATPYTTQPRDVVTNDGSSFVCILAHTSDAADEPGVGANWETYWQLLAQFGSDGRQRVTINANTALSRATHHAKILDVTGAYTLTGVAANLGVDFFCEVINTTDTDVTFTSTDNINDLTDDFVNSDFIITGNGTNFKCRSGGGGGKEEFDGLANFPATGDSSKLYLDVSTGKTYSWDEDGTSNQYVETGSTDGLQSDGRTQIADHANRLAAVEGRDNGADAILEDQKASGGNGGTATAGAYATRDLNTKVYDPQSLITLSSNEFTPTVAGEVSWQCPAGVVNDHKTRLWNVTDGVVTKIGTNATAGGGLNVFTRSSGKSRVEAGKTYRLEHRVTTTRATDGYGSPCSFGDVEIYSRLEFRRDY